MFACCMQVLCYTFLRCFNHLLLFINMAAAEGCTGRIIKALAAMELTAHHPFQEKATRVREL